MTQRIVRKFNSVVFSFGYDILKNYYQFDDHNGDMKPRRGLELFLVRAWIDYSKFKYWLCQFVVLVLRNSCNLN